MDLISNQPTFCMALISIEFPISFFLAAWLKRELVKHNCGLGVEKLCGDNSHEEKERVTRLFRDG